MKQLSFGMQNSNLGRPSAARLSAGALSLAVTALGALTVHAHPGHALGEQGAAHVVSSPYHLSILAGTGLALWLGARFIQRRFPRRLMQLGGVAAVIGAAVLWGLRA